MLFRNFICIGALCTLVACGGDPEESSETANTAQADATTGTAPVQQPERTAATAEEVLDLALNGAHRSDGNRARDAWRNPGETLLFFGVEPDSTVVEVYPGAGWYSEVLAPALRDRGQLVAAVPHPDRGENAARGLENYREMLNAHPDVFDRVEVRTVEGGEPMRFGEPGSADVVLTFRNLHGITRAGELDHFLAAVHDVLEPGGVLGVVAHRAAEDADPEVSVQSGYLPEAFVIQQVQSAGFRLDARVEINANPADTRDHPNGVWSLPPVLRVDEADMDRYQAIGESDRMTLRFVRE